MHTFRWTPAPQKGRNAADRGGGAGAKEGPVESAPNVQFLLSRAKRKSEEKVPTQRGLGGGFEAIGLPHVR